MTCDDWKGFGDTSGAEVNRRPRLEGSEVKAGERSRSVMVLVDRMELALTDSGRSITKKYEGISAKNPNASGKKMEGREEGREGGTCILPKKFLDREFVQRSLQESCQETHDRDLARRSCTESRTEILPGHLFYPLLVILYRDIA